MNSYRIYLLDGNDYAELDVDDLSFSTIFSVSDIQDLSKRKDSLSKNIKLKGTKNNNRIFGNLYNINRSVADNTIENLFINYKPSQKIDCLVYENDTLIISKGQLQIINIEIDSSNTITYEAVITGAVINFYSLLGGKKLEDLDFSEYAHTFNWLNIELSLDNIYTGVGYTYPFIIYKNNEADYNKIYNSNFRAAVFVREYFKKIFNQPSLSGFTYEIKGSTGFTSNFDRLIIPNNSEKLTNTYIGSGTTAIELIKSTPTTNGGGSWVESGSYLKRAVVFNSVTDPLSLVSTGGFNFVSNNLFLFDRDVDADGKIDINISISNGANPNPMNCSMVIGERNDSEAGVNEYTFTTIAEKFIATVNPNTVFPATDITFNIPNRTFEKGKQYVLYLYAQGASNGYTDTYFNVTVNSAKISFPSEPSNLITYNVSIGDTVTPQAPKDILQTDFIKSIIKMFNFYVYSSMDNPKHIIFEKYDDFYSNTTDAIDWSNKIDYSSGLNLLMNLDADKRYSFEMKEDSDYFNADLYKNRYNTTFGNYTTASTDGIAKAEKVEVIFSPTPLMKYNNTNRIHPSIYKVGSSGSEPVKSNIRILYFSGAKDCLGYTFLNSDGSTNISGITRYGACGHILYEDGNTNYTYKSDLNFGLAKEYFQGVTEQIYNVPNLFNNYSNLIDELNNPNFLTLECDALLNEIDISNLDFKRPIYINTPSGDAFFKLLEVTYQNANEISQIKLQKIIV